MPDGAADAADDIARLRARLWEAGYRPVALYSNDKRPIGGAWQARARRDPPEAAAGTARPDALNTGVLCDGLRAIDLDVDDAALAERLEAMAVGVFGPAPVRWRDNSGRRLLVYRAAEGEPPKRSVVGMGGKVEVLGRGQQFHAHGLHPSGTEVRWRLEPLTAVAEAQIGAFLASAAPLIGAEPPRRRGGAARARVRRRATGGGPRRPPPRPSYARCWRASRTTARPTGSGST